MDWFAEIAEGYDGLAYATSAERYAGVLENLPPATGRLLDAGCGSGVLAVRLASEVRQIVGIDVSPAMLALARRRCAEAQARNVALVFGKVEQPPFPDHAFDVVVSCYVLHAVALDIALPVLRRVVRPGGRLVIVSLVSPWPRLHALRVARLWTAVVTTPGLLLRHGSRITWRVVAHRLRRAWYGPWSEMLRPTPDAFRDACARWLPGSRMMRRRGRATTVWDAPLPAPSP